MGIRQDVKRRDRRKAKASDWTRLPKTGSKNKVVHAAHAVSVGKPNTKPNKRDLKKQVAQNDEAPEPLRVTLKDFMTGGTP